MSRTRTIELSLLKKCESKLQSAAAPYSTRSAEARTQILEAVASLAGGFPLGEYYRAFGIKAVDSSANLLRLGREVLNEVLTTSIPTPLALSAMGADTKDIRARKKTGSYQTDFRLAMHLASLALSATKEHARVLDPACGSGMLLSALTLTVCGKNKKKARSWLEQSVYAADLSPAALRAATASLACFTDCVAALKLMRSHWRVQDSLLTPHGTWSELAPDGFDIILANPPWEKLKLTRHEFLQSAGNRRHYGSAYQKMDAAAFCRESSELESYVAKLSDRFPHLSTEPDLYAAFLELFLEIVRPGGRINVLVPAGLIRSQRTSSLRERLIGRSAKLCISVLENRARFFDIDTRFKFLAIACDLPASSASSRSRALLLLHESGTETGVREYGRVHIPLSDLKKLRPDLSIPEVRNPKEWRLFCTMSRTAKSSIKDEWTPEIVREVDMTKGRPRFKGEIAAGLIPVVEGRMVHQHRFGAKSYVSGSGRRAIWRINALGSSRIWPQFYINPEHVSPKARKRTMQSRAGFCDITGQTNERSMMASIVPSGVICGNKVPTITFPGDDSLERLLLWTAIVNSFPFDWMMRRVVTTTVNYFVLLSLPLPALGKESLPGRHLIEAARQLYQLDHNPQGFEEAWTAAEFRARIDVAVSIAYDLSVDDIALILEDFPLLDRGQPALPNEQRSTITKDFLLWQARRRAGEQDNDLAKRVTLAKAMGAIPYVPSDVVANAEEVESVDYG